jgi:hypothetical protein
MRFELFHDGVRRRFQFLAVFLVVALTGCGNSNSLRETPLKGLAHSREGRNVAVLIGAPNGLPGVPTDILELDSLFKSPGLDLGFDEVVRDDSATTREIFAASADASRDADSLFWYFSGHGNTGILLAEDRSFTFSEVANAVMEARQGRPLERLVVMLDSCYSGSFVDGRTPIIPSNQSGEVVRSKCVPVAGAMMDTEDAMSEIGKFEGSLFKQAFVLASSTKNETSSDLGRSKGGAFTWSLRGVIQRFSQSERSATILKVSQQTRVDTDKIAGHTPVWRAFPSTQILGEKFFLYE